jgi:hypothetical protein
VPETVVNLRLMLLVSCGICGVMILVIRECLMRGTRDEKMVKTLLTYSRS